MNGKRTALQRWVMGALGGLSVIATSVALAAPRPVVFVGNNWDGTVNVFDAQTYSKVGLINVVPDKTQRMTELLLNPVKLVAFQAVRNLIGEGNDQLVDDMYSSNDGRLLIASRPSLADVVAIEIATNKIVWRFKVDGYRSDHMALSPDGTKVAVSASTGNVVHVLDVNTGQQVGKFASGNSPHENVYSKDGSKIYHASIGLVFTPLDPNFYDWTKGERIVQVVDAKTYQIIKKFNMADKLKAAGTIVWNGPVGVFEFAAFENGTKQIAQAIAESPAFSIAGGGDTLAAIAKYGIEKQVGYISTGGGAFLEVLEGKTLPAFEILEKRAAGN